MAELKEPQLQVMKRPRCFDQVLEPKKYMLVVGKLENSFKKNCP